MEAANEPVFEDFEGTDAGDGVEFEPSYGASGDQSRAVVAGADADVVHYSLETDVTRLVDEGLVAEDWKDNATNGIATSSVVVFVVRAGNPEDIETWDDLVKPGVEIITPNPGSSGSARWNILAAWAHVTGDGDNEADGQGVPDQAAQQHHRAPGAAAVRRPPRSPTAAATCCSPTRTRRSSPSRAARTSTTSSRRTPCSSRTRPRSPSTPTTPPRRSSSS